MSATIRDVAKLAGVSASTVSRVINKSAPISGETTERIYRAMEELKYVPNDIARSFASGSARAIAIAVNVSDTRSYANRFFNNTVFGIETAAHRKGYNFIITSANDERGGMGSLEKLILSKKIDGLVLPVSLLQSSIVKLVEEMSFPFVVLGRVKNAGSRLSWVDISNEQAGAASRMGDRGGYLFTSARDMAKLWTAGYGFLFAGQTAGVQNITPESLQWLSGDMTNSLNSCIHAALGDADAVYTKAGWINGEGDLYVLNDAGLVMSQSGTYVLAVLTNACGRNDLLTSLIGTLDAVHSGDMRG